MLISYEGLEPSLYLNLKTAEIEQYKEQPIIVSTAVVKFEVIRLRTESGFNILMTDYQKVVKDNGVMVYVKDLEVGDRLAAVNMDGEYAFDKVKKVSYVQFKGEKPVVHLLSVEPKNNISITDHKNSNLVLFVGR